MFEVWPYHHRKTLPCHIWWWERELKENGKRDRHETDNIFGKAHRHFWYITLENCVRALERTANHCLSITIYDQMRGREREREKDGTESFSRERSNLIKCCNIDAIASLSLSRLCVYVHVLFSQNSCAEHKYGRDGVTQIEPPGWPTKESIYQLLTRSN